MRLPMVDCRSLIEFCKAFEQHKNMAANKPSPKPNNNNNNNNNNNPPKKQLKNPFCEHSPFALFDILLLFVMLGSLGFLAAPYLRFLSHHASEAIDLLSEAVRDAPLAYLIGLIIAFLIVIGGIATWEFLETQARKCKNGNCKGLRKAVEFDIQLESEECVRFLPQTSSSKSGFYGGGVRPLELGDDHKELEAELKRMAPVNGRTVLIFRAPCGCPAGRLEVWGAKKVRKIKK